MKMNVYHVVCFLVLVNTPLGLDATLDDAWDRWRRLYRKEISGSNDDKRREIWEANLREIQAHNLKYDLGEVTYTMGLNQFSDMEWEEFKEIYLPGLLTPPDFESTSRQTQSSRVPESMDWRTVKNVVTSVKDQRACGSCWAFAATGAIEGQYNQHFGEAVEFSEQQLVDCSTAYGNFGCRGGWMNKAFKYVKDDGLELEDSYPYIGWYSYCHHSHDKSRVTVRNITHVTFADEENMKQVLGLFGPVAIAVNIGGKFQNYKSGIFASDHCSQFMLNHAMLAVGYGTEGGKDYWIVKNSWTKTWGEQGYIRMARNNRNMCGIASYASVPGVDKMSGIFVANECSQYRLDHAVRAVGYGAEDEKD